MRKKQLLHSFKIIIQNYLRDMIFSKKKKKFNDNNNPSYQKRELK